MNILVIGRRTSGKSTLGLFLARRIQQRKGGHVIPVFDPKRSFKNLPHTSDMETFEDMLERPSFWAISFQPPQNTNFESRSTDEVAEAFTFFCDALAIDEHMGVQNARRKNLGATPIVIDESWLLQSATFAHPWIESLVRLADSEKVYLIQCAHRLGDLSTRVRAQANEYYLFRQTLASDLDAVATQCGTEVAEKVSMLDGHEVIRFNVDAGEIESWNDPRGWFMDISKGGRDVTSNNAIQQANAVHASGSSGSESQDQASANDSAGKIPTSETRCA